MRTLSSLLALAIVLATAPAEAQGRGNGANKGRKTPAAAATADTSAAAASSGTLASTGFREFGSWLDDATLVDPGGGWLSFALGHYRSPGSHQTDFPATDAALGVDRRLQLGVTVPYSHYSFPESEGISGRGDVYLNAKIALRDPAAPGHRGLALSPIVEILSEPDPVHGGRVFWGLPLSGELRASGFRLYGSTGYFSRRVLFGSGAIEKPATDRVVITAALTYARSLSNDTAADAASLASTRVDLTGGVAYALTPRIAAFGSVGRTISSVDENASTLMLNTGVSISFARPGSPKRRP